jgi:hypothetical protein
VDRNYNIKSFGASVRCLMDWLSITYRLLSLS